MRNSSGYEKTQYTSGRFGDSYIMIQVSIGPGFGISMSRTNTQTGDDFFIGPNWETYRFRGR